MVIVECIVYTVMFSNQTKYSRVFELRYGSKSEIYFFLLFTLQKFKGSPVVEGGCPQQHLVCKKYYQFFAGPR